MVLSSERTYKLLAFTNSGETYEQFTQMLVMLLSWLQNTPVKINAVWVLFKAEQQLLICQALIDRNPGRDVYLSSGWGTVNERRIYAGFRVSICFRAIYRVVTQVCGAKGTLFSARNLESQKIIHKIDLRKDSRPWRWSLCTWLRKHASGLSLPWIFLK